MLNTFSFYFCVHSVSAYWASITLRPLQRRHCNSHYKTRLTIWYTLQLLMLWSNYWTLREFNFLCGITKINLSNNLLAHYAKIFVIILFALLKLVPNSPHTLCTVFEKFISVRDPLQNEKEQAAWEFVFRLQCHSLPTLQLALF